MYLLKLVSKVELSFGNFPCSSKISELFFCFWRYLGQDFPPNWLSPLVITAPVETLVANAAKLIGRFACREVSFFRP